MGRPNIRAISDLPYLGRNPELCAFCEKLDESILSISPSIHHHINSENVVYELRRIFATVKPRANVLLMRLRIDIESIDDEFELFSQSTQKVHDGKWIQAKLEHVDLLDYAVSLARQTFEYSRIHS